MNRPFLLRPTGKDYLWGGRKLHNEFNKSIEMEPLAETWECSTHPDGYSYVESGKYQGSSLAEIICEHPEYLGTRNAGLSSLPILIKLIDAEKNLSVQVHPDDMYAKANENGQLGKMELWYVLGAEKDARIIYGFYSDCQKDTIRNSIADGTLEKYLQSVPVKKDDVFFIPPGLVHAIGAGCLIVEIQESSNLTYRLFDYNRVDKNGRKRELHIDKALQVLDLESSATPRQPMRILRYRMGYASELLCRCKYFTVFRLLINTENGQSVDYQAENSSYRVLLCTDGSGEIRFSDERILLQKGACVFVPADSEIIQMRGKMQFVEVLS